MQLISISIVSHLQGSLVARLLADIECYCKNKNLEVILTLNLPEAPPFAQSDFLFPLKLIHNSSPLGFGENHNQAFQQSRGQFFCVINPDIRIDHDPFTALVASLQDSSIGVAGPIVVNENGSMEDSARRFPTPFKILCKAIGGCKGSDYFVKDEVVFPDWVGGMFMMFRRETFGQSGGFDQRYFLYYEDVDLCARLRLRGFQVALCPGAKVVHHAHRSSHRNFKYLRWHLSSMLRFFTSSPFLNICRIRLKNNIQK
jgi:GT2 family glycosyltransferase